MVQNIYAYMGEGCFHPKCFKDFSRTNSTRRTIPCDVCENSCVLRESRCYENNVCTRRLTHLFLLDDGVIFGENIVCCAWFVTILLSVSHFSPSFVTMSSSKSIGVGRVNRWTRNSAERFEITTMNLWRSPGTTSTWCLMRRLWNQNDSQRRLKTQVLIQVP